MKNTKIEYADHSWSPWRGCRKVSPGCQNCFAERIWRRLGVEPGGRQLAKDRYWKEPLKWNRFALQCTECGSRFADPKRLGQPFVCPQCYHPLCQSPQRVLVDLCDPFDSEVKDAWRHRFFELIAATPNLTWLLLTKRPERVSECWPCGWWDHPLPNVWMGVSVEDQQRADERIHALLRIPAVKRWVSVEPLLGPVDLTNRGIRNGYSVATSTDVDGLGVEWTDPGPGFIGLDWIVVGGESAKPKPKARPCDLDWIRGIIRQGREAGVPVFVKQVGTNGYVPAPYGPITHPKGGDPAEWPEDLRVRQYP